MPPVKIAINRECNGCGICVRICPARAFTLVEQRAVLSGSCTFACDHCAAACPQQAITTELFPAEPFNFSSFAVDQNPAAATTLSGLVRLMRSRRSCRLYQDKAVERKILTDLIKIAITAPSGTNSQKWTFSIIDNRRRVIDFGTEIAAYYRRLNRLAEKSWLRKILTICGQPQLEHYYEEYYESISEGLELWYNKKEDRLFHGACAVILIGAEPGASCPREDALLATQNLLLAAESMGLGTCLIGFAVEAMHRDRKIKATLNIPAAETIYSVIALGYPQLRFQRPAQRRKIDINWIS